MARRKKQSRTKKPKEPMFDDLSPQTRQAIGAVFTAALGIFILFTLFEAAGPVGRYTNVALEFLLGAGAWLTPLFCVVYIFVLLNPKDDEEVSVSKVVGTILLFVTVLAGMELYREGLGGILGLSLEWPLTYLLGTTVTGVLLFALLLVSVFLIFNTGLHFRRKPKEELLEDDLFSDEFDAVGEEAEQPLEDSPEETGESEEAKEQALAAMAKKVANMTKGKPSEIVVKNFSGTYVPPSLSLLSKQKGKPQTGDIRTNAMIIKRTLRDFGISVEMDAAESGPTVTRYSLKPAQGVRVSKIAGLHEDLQLALKAPSIRIEAPIPGKSLVGIEVPNETRATVALSSLLSTPEYTDSPHPLMTALGKDVTGEVHFANIARMPHGLIAGTTGSGKSVAIHNIIISLLFRNSPEQVRFILVDPKRVELTLYNKIPHLLTPVITDAKKAIRALSWAVKEMERRYDILESEKMQNIASYHQKVYRPAKEEWEKAGADEEMRALLPEALPYIVIILDELNDIMQAYPRELEAMIVRLAQMSRAVGIHLILATQRPSVNVITGTIKANIPTRIAMAVASQIDSRTILDATGAEKLLGAGDMLYLPSDSPKPIRLQSAFISEDEIKKVVEYLKKQDAHELDTLDFDEASQDQGADSFFKTLAGSDDDMEDALYEEAKLAVLEAGKASTSYLQRKLRVGYSRAARLIDLLEENGVVGPADGSKARDIIMTPQDLEAEATEDEDTDEELEETERNHHA
jgi:S-DNA-T family DNA segregation ATPase FtsK/SpoIIIE